MKKIIILLLCCIYTFVSFGGAIYIHKCSGDMSLSIYDKTNHEDCGNCIDYHTSEEQNHGNCTDGKCDDLEVKIDQLQDKPIFSSTYISPIISPFISIIYWISYYIDIPEKEFISIDYDRNNIKLSRSSTSLIIKNNIFRI